MASNDEFYNMIQAQASADPEMKKLLASTEGVLEESPQVESQGEENSPVAQLVVFDDNRTMLQVSTAADPEVVLSALHHAIQIIEEQFDSDEE